jgi:hypothetical protein
MRHDELYIGDLVEQAMDIMRAEFPELAKTYEPETTVEPGQEQTA